MMLLDEIIHDSETLRRVEEQKQKLRSHPLIVFSASNGGRTLIELLRANGVEPSGVCDSDPKKHGTTLEGIPVGSFAATLARCGGDSNVVVGSIAFLSQIRRQLLALGFPAERVVSGGVLPAVPRSIAPSTAARCYDPDSLREHETAIMHLLESLGDEISRDVVKNILRHRIYGPLLDPYPLLRQSDQYFLPSLVRLGEQEVFLDGGAFTGDTIAEFLNHAPNRSYASIHAFEPGDAVLPKLHASVAALPRVHVHACGLSNRDADARMHVLPGACPQLSDEGSSTIRLVKGDRLGLSPTFIKLDVEGEELNALEGLRETIRRCRPRLAICVYHKYDDLWRIPLWIKETNPRYRIAIRHHSDNAAETVCYAQL